MRKNFYPHRDADYITRKKCPRPSGLIGNHPAEDAFSMTLAVDMVAEKARDGWFQDHPRARFSISAPF
jgi:hypothetical protein